MSTSAAFDRYCALGEHVLQGDEQKFCYDTSSIRKDLHRLMDLGADARRICKRVRSVNSDFCSGRVSFSAGAAELSGDVRRDPVDSHENTGVRSKNLGVHLNERNKKGIIFI